MRLLTGWPVVLAFALAACSSTPEEAVEGTAESPAGQEAAASETASSAILGEADEGVSQPWLGRLGLLTWGEGSPPAPQAQIVQSAEEFAALEIQYGVELGDPPDPDQHVTVVFLGTQPYPIDFMFLRRNAVKDGRRTLVLRHSPADPDEDEGIRANAPWAVIRHRGPVYGETEIQFETTVDGAVVQMPERSLRVHTVPLASPEPELEQGDGSADAAAPVPQ